MYLKRLESIGFKSFAERVKIDFVPGVTAIVGPNGSGKSNITDAIQWVLGEQSVKSLRGSKMEDIIFQGSDTRNALNVAEVTLVLDNTDQQLPLDYGEVSVTRRLFRSGESEFFINKEPCRLRDIVELFLDSGLGRDSFSIIGQGKVEEVLRSKAEDRRSIFEEAAGVLKYKLRKERAELRLQETEENLDRLNDILYEIQSQIGPLEKQAQKAKKYIDLRDQLKQLEISYLRTTIDQLHTEWKVLEQKVVDEQAIEISLQAKIQKKEAFITEQRQNIQQIDEKIEFLQTQLLQNTQNLEKYEGEKNVSKERMKHFETTKEQLQEQIDNNHQSIRTLQLKIAKEKKILHQYDQEIIHTNSQRKKIKHQLAVQHEDLKNKIEELQSLYIERLNEQAAKKNEIQSLERQITQLNMQQAHQREDLNQLQKKHLEIEKEYQRVRDFYEKLTLEIRKHDEQSTYYEQKHTNVEEQLHLQQQKINELNEQIVQLQSRKEMIEEMKNEYEGYFFGVKNILKAKDNDELSNIYGAVLELIQIPSKYLLAIDTILGGQAQNIVVEKDEDARKAIAWLKKYRKGRATFLPLQSIVPRNIPIEMVQRIASHKGFIGIADDLIKTEHKFERVLKHLLGNVVVVFDLKSANEISKIMDRKYRIVTLQGDVVYPGGSMTGGEQRTKQRSLFTRDQELKEIEKRLIEYQKKINHHKNVIEQLRAEMKKIASVQDKLKQTKKELENRASQIRDDLQTITLDQRTNQNHILLNKNEQHSLKEMVQELITEKETNLIQLKEIEQQLREHEKEIGKTVEQERKWNKKSEKLKEDYHRYEIQLAELEERKRNQLEKVNSYEEQMNELQREQEKYEKEYHEFIVAFKNQETIESLERKIVETKNLVGQQTEEIQMLRKDRLTRTQRINDDENELKELNRLQKLTLEKTQKLEVEMNRLDVLLENKLLQLQEDYSISYEKAKETYEKIEDIDGVKHEIEQLKGSLRSLGTVNLGAIDEHQRITKRYQFLTEQKEDLEQAKETLFQVIAEMDQVMKERFETTFAQINHEFQIVFRELFGGGRAELRLSDPDDLLKTGIEMIAQPPGKKLQHLSLLSGGEKSLTAIALLFAILRVRPVPFCVLDEVESALDEVNVVRFAKYVKLHSDQTQFIVITHRKGTMEEADVLYGVTMQESGVSRLVSVQLEDHEEFIHTS